MRSLKPYARLCAALLALFLCWGGALYWAQWLAEEYRGVSVRLQGGGVRAEAIDAALKESAAEAPRLCAWTRSALDITLVNEALGAQARARRVAVYGDMADVCPMTLIRGALPPSIDDSGCVIDEATAIGLFRNLDVIGASIKLDGKRYAVRAVVGAREPTILLRDADAEYENLELTFANVERASAQAESFLYSFATGGERVLVESGLYARLAAGLAALPELCVAAAILFAILRQAYKRRTIPLQLAFLGIAAACAFIALRWLLKLEIYWPDRFLPTRWSDFSFWPETLKGQLAYFDRLAFLEPVPKDMQWRSAVRMLLLCVAGAALATLFLLTKGRAAMKGLSAGALGCIFACLAVAVVILHISGRPFAPSAGYLYAAPVLWLFEGISALTANMQRQAAQFFNE